MVVFVVFFFKQKTAYEMRISDWSSDVCSSDLPPRHLHFEHHWFEPDGHAAHRAPPISVPSQLLPGGHFGLIFRFQLEDNLPLLIQIGRASCRERVCQYV